MKNIKVFSVTVLMCAFSFKAQAQFLKDVKFDKSAARGLCLPKLKEKPSAVLKRNKINVYTVGSKKDDFKRTEIPGKDLDGRSYAVAQLIAAIENTGDGRFDYHKGEDFFFSNRDDGVSRPNSRGVVISASEDNYKALKSSPTSNFSGQTNRALLAKMLGYKVAEANKRGSNLQRYLNADAGNCKVSKFAKKNTAEDEFAQVFAAYLTNPSLLITLSNKKSCKNALKFMKNLFGETKTGKSCRASKDFRSEKTVARIIRNEQRKSDSNKVKRVINREQRRADNKKIDEIIGKDLKKQKKAKYIKDLTERERKLQKEINDAGTSLY